MFSTLLTWWRGATFGTRLWTWRRGRYVGADDQGNRYYEERPRKTRRDPTHAHAAGRRWVIYNGTVEASRIPPEWHAWIHHIVDVPPSDSMPRVKPWEAKHQANLTGTAYAYRPKGSLARATPGSAAEPAYQAWQPGSE